MMDRRAFGMAALSMAATAPLAALAQAEATTLRYATFLPPNGIFTGSDGAMGRWGKAVEADSGGLVKLQIFPGGTLGAAGRSPGAQLKLVTDGIADVSFIIPSTTPGRFPDDNIFGFPVTQSSEEGSLTFWRLYQQGLMRGYDDKSFYIIGLLVNPPNVLHLKEPLKRLEDMRSLRIQTSGAEQQEVLRALGATPVGSVTVREAAEAISRGVVDGSPKDWLAMQSFRIGEAAPYHVNIGLGASTIMLAMNRAKYDSLPEKARQAIDKHSGEAFVRMTARMFDERTAAAMKATLADKRHTLIELPPAERARWDAATAGTIETWRGKDATNEKLWQAFTRTRAEVRRDLGLPKL